MPTILKERYILKNAVRSGRLAEVFAAYDHATDQKVAVKMFKRGLPNEPVIREAFRRESQRLIHLRHRTLIGMLDFGEDGPDGRPYVVLEWGGDPLDQWLQGDCPYRDWNEFYQSVGRPLLEGIAYAHSRETVHRELKPSDFLVDEMGRIRLADFGVSKFPEFLDQELNIAEFIRANEPFAPVNGYDPSYSYATDVWGYAAICLFILTKGKLQKWSQIPGALADLPAADEVRAALQDALREEAAERPADAQVLLDKLDAAERKTRKAAQRMVCAVDLTKTAIDRLRQLVPGLETPREIETWLYNELNEAPAAWEPFSTVDEVTRQKTVVPDTYWLMGQSLSLILVVDKASRSKWVATSVSRHVSEAAFDQIRSRAWACDIEFRVGRYATAPNGSENIEFVLAGITAHLEKADDRQLLQEEERLFRSWNDLLQVRLDHTKELKFYDYRGVDTDGNRITFRIEDKVDPAILEETWGIADSRIFGVVDHVSDHTITLYVDEADGREVRESGRLVIDARATERQLKIQLDALGAIRFPRNARQEILKRCILHPSGAEIQPGGSTVSHWFSENLDDNKREVIQAALASRDIFLVEGPPGTGKTTFIAELILQYLERHPNERILLTSQTHIAVDNAIERVSKFKPNLRITRVGRREAKVAESVHRYLLANRIQAWRESVYAAASKFLKDRAAQQGLNPSEIQMGLDAGLMVRSRQELLQAEASETESEKELLAIEAELSAKDADGNPLADGERGKFLEDERDRTSEHLSNLRQVRKDRASVARKLSDIFRKHYPDYADLAGKSTAEIIEWQDALIGDSPAAQRFRLLFELNAEWMQRFTRDEDCEEAILLDSELIAGTCIGIANSDAEGEGYGLCILDEASKAALPEALVPMVRSEKWVLVGDQRQLSPFMDAVTRNRGLLAEKGIDRDVVGETLLGRLTRLGMPPHAKAMLTRQHRMTPAIGNMVSTVFYDGLLQSVGGQTLPRSITQVFPSPVTWITTSRHAHRSEQRSNSSYINPLEARSIRKILDRLEFLQKHQSKGTAAAPIKVAILTGYSAQRTHLDSILAAESRPHLDVEVHTVDAYQGREADLVILSVTRSNKTRQSGFLGERERINVALSRARFALWIVGDADFCRDLGATSPLAEVRDYIEAHAGDCAIAQEDIE
jgi:serine/threonine protein kinase